MTPDRFVTELATIRLGDVFNPYADRCPDHDRANAPEIRRRNLKLVLGAALDLGVDTIWLGRDLGYRGGRRTGLALTDERQLQSVRHAFGDLPLQQATSTGPISERTAQEVWKVISQLPRAPLLWNVFPFHPFESGDPMTNRCHTAREARCCQNILGTLLEWLHPAHIVALGNDAHRALNRLGWNSICVRHPSYGGQAAFTKGIFDLYGLPVDTDERRSPS